MNRCMIAFLFAASTLGIQAQALDPTWVWEAKLPPFAKTKPVVRTNTLWRSQQGQIWVGFTCFLEDTGILFTGIRPTIAGTTESWDGEINCKYVGEYVGQSGQTIWFPMGVGTGICAGQVPIADPPSQVRVYSGEGALLKTFIPELGVVVPSWEPSLGSNAMLNFRQVKGASPETWKTNHTVAAYMRASGDGGMTWTNFGRWIDPGNPSQTIPGAFLQKPEILVDVFSTYGLHFEITRYRLTPEKPGGTPMVAPITVQSREANTP